MKQTNFSRTFWAMMIVLGLVAVGCTSSSSKLLEQVSGVWKRAQGDGTVQISLAGDLKTVVFDGHSYVATIKKTDTTSRAVDLQVDKSGSGQPETWTIRQVWDETGSSYKLIFNHDGQKEQLPQKATS